MIRLGGVCPSAILMGQWKEQEGGCEYRYDNISLWLPPRPGPHRPGGGEPAPAAEDDRRPGGKAHPPLAGKGPLGGGVPKLAL